MNVQVPTITPRVAGESRLRWSVMIPTFNCADLLRLTLRSVLDQAPPADQMQIQVVDDLSNKDDPAAVVREVGGGRVEFFRQPANCGAIRNFNTCIERSRGDLVHILHGDDLVLPGFYEKIGAAADEYRDVALMASRTFVIDECGVVASVSQRVNELEQGGRSTASFNYSTPLFTPSVVVRRSFYEEHGGFTPTLAHTADWEMWARAVRVGGGVVLPDVLCCYRFFAANDTSRLKRTADNLRDKERLFSVLSERHDGFEWHEAIKALTEEARFQIEWFRKRGDNEAHAANRAYLRSKLTFQNRAVYAAKTLMKRFRL